MNEENEKEVINGYEIKSAVWVGTEQFLFGVHKDKNEPQRYLKCKKVSNELFFVYENGVSCDDYFEANRGQKAACLFAKHY